jgi:hypothetical protein
MIPLFFFSSTALSPPACYPAHPPRAGSWMRDDVCGKRNIHREHLDEKWRVWDRESSIGSTWREREREREGDEERFHSLSVLALLSRSLARLPARGKTDWSNTCTVAATAAERIATSSSRSNSSAVGAANNNKKLQSPAHPSKQSSFTIIIIITWEEEAAPGIKFLPIIHSYLAMCRY